jgi:putative redox protein
MASYEESTHTNALSPVEASFISEPVDPAPYQAVARLAMPNVANMAFEGIAPSGHTITMDTDPESGGQGKGADPKSLLLLALASCTGMDVISIMRKKRQDVTAYRINVFATEATEHPKIYTYILVEHIISGRDIDPKAIARSLQLSITKYCPVHALLSRVTRVEHVYRILA